MKTTSITLIRFFNPVRRRIKVVFILILFLFLHRPEISAQSYTSSNPGNFGIDGDVYSDTVLNGSFTAEGSHDWFYKLGHSGTGIFDTVGTDYARQQINSGVNYGFSKKMQYPQYTTLGGNLLLDGVYTRDYTGNGSLLDITAFNTVSTNNSAMDPTTWTTLTTGSNSIPGKVDIIDTYIHMRRLSNASNHVIAYLGASTMATTGNRYFDFEFYKSQIGYDSNQGKFINSGPSATGGHNAWVFNADGSINSFGDLTLSFSFSSIAVSSIDIYIWVSYSVYSTTVPSSFDFTAGSWVGLNNSGGYGYARIQAKAGNTLQAWGMVNTAATSGPPWSGSYSSGQFAEAAIDLTSLGIDPLIAASSDPCAPPYTRVLIKSRSSSSFSAALQDFVGPIIFLNAFPLATITPVSPLSCAQSSLILQPVLLGATTSYNWSTLNGSFTSRTDSAAVGINKLGKYFLTARSSNCNNSTIDSIVVLQDMYTPVASANYVGSLTSDPNSYVTLRGGDTTASNYSTPFGGSQGLFWSWTGPGGFTSAIQNPTTKQAGDYMLKVTEKRNGCSAVATTTVTKDVALGVKIISFHGRFDPSSTRVRLEWETAGEARTPVYVEVQKSTDGIHFTAIAMEAIQGPQRIYHVEDTNLQNDLYYRLAWRSNPSQTISTMVKLSLPNLEAAVKAYLQSPNQLVVRYTAFRSETVTIQLLNSNGIVCDQLQQRVVPGTTQFLFHLDRIETDLYIIRVLSESTIKAIKRILPAREL